MFNGTFSYWFNRNATALSIPAGLFDGIYTSSALDIRGLYSQTFGMWFGNNVTGIADSSGLFKSLDTSHLSPTTTYGLFNHTFADLVGDGIASGATCRSQNISGPFTPSSYVDIGNIFNGADLSGITAGGTDNSTLGSTFNRTFFECINSDSSSGAWLTGSAVSGLIGVSPSTGPLYGLNPASRAYTFYGQNLLTDYSTINANWK
jgi:hypothetical protein